MSSLTGKEIRELDLDRYLKLIAFTILFHEYCLTFRLEVERFWSQKKTTLVPLLFFLNRYLVLFGYVPSMFLDFWFPKANDKQMICRSLHSYDQLHVVAVQIVVAVILVMRTHALYNRSFRMLVLMITVVLAAVAIGCWGIATTKGDGAIKSKEYFLIIGCATPRSRAEGLRLATAWSGMLVFDTLIFILTVYKSLALRVRSGSGLLAVMLRDGSLYFGVMVASNVANILTYVYGGTFTRGSIAVFVSIISSVMITRLMLNLRDPKLSTVPRLSPTNVVNLYTSGIFSTVVVARTEIDGDDVCESHEYPPRNWYTGGY